MAEHHVSEPRMSRLTDGTPIVIIDEVHTFEPGEMERLMRANRAQPERWSMDDLDA